MGEKCGFFLPRTQDRLTQLWIQTVRTQKVTGRAPPRLHSSECRRWEYRGRSGQQGITEAQRFSQASRLPASPCLSGPATAHSPAAAPPKGPRRAYMQQLEEGGWNKDLFQMEKQRSQGELLTRPRALCTQLPWQGMRDCCPPLKTIALEMGWLGRKRSVEALSLLCSVSGGPWELSPRQREEPWRRSGQLPKDAWPHLELCPGEEAAAECTLPASL